jgi:hypothetical protein
VSTGACGRVVSLVKLRTSAVSLAVPSSSRDGSSSTRLRDLRTGYFGFPP